MITDCKDNPTDCTLMFFSHRSKSHVDSFKTKILQNLNPLDDLLEPPKPTIELKPMPSALRYAFLNND